MSNTNTNANVDILKAEYKAARESLKAAIRANQVAMRTFRSKPSSEHKIAYDRTRKEVQAQLANIKAVRSDFYTELNAQTTLA